MSKESKEDQKKSYLIDDFETQQQRYRNVFKGQNILPVEIETSVETYGERIKTRREILRITQPQLGAVIGVDGARISQIENGKTKSIKRDYIIPLADALQCTTDYLLGLVNDITLHVTWKDSSSPGGVGRLEKPMPDFMKLDPPAIGNLYMVSTCQCQPLNLFIPPSHARAELIFY